MGRFTCSRCRAVGDDSTASVGENGLLCAACAARDTQRSDDKTFDRFIAGGVTGVVVGAALDEASAAQMQSAMFSAGTKIALPATGLHAKLLARGYRCERYAQPDARARAAGRHRVSETWLLPSTPPVQATFGPEGFTHALGKLFTREIQVGDKAFDDAVFIRTSTPAETANWLESPDVRAAIQFAVTSGGSVAIDGNSLEGSACWSAAETARDEVFATLAESLRA